MATSRALPVFITSGSSFSNGLRSKSGFFPAPQRPRGKPASQGLGRPLTVVALAALIVLTVFLQLRFIRYSSAAGEGAGRLDRMDRGGGGAAAADADAARPPLPPAEAPPGGYPAPALQHLVLVAGHAVYTGVDYALAPKESSWFLEPYQQVPGQAQSFLDHIRLGVETAATDAEALLLFSGGQTRRAAGPRSEGLSYWMVAEAAGWFGHPEVRDRAFVEEHARDSFENVLFSLCRFFELTGHFPQRLTAVSYTLKQQRFEQLHRAAVKFPAAAFRFVGTPVPPDATGAPAGEAATVAAFRKDPYGCSGSLLAKKAHRDPFAVGPPHPSRCPAMADLLRYCSHRVFPGAVPWGAGDEGGGGGAGAGGKAAAGLLPSGRRSSRSGIYTR